MLGQGKRPYCVLTVTRICRLPTKLRYLIFRIHCLKTVNFTVSYDPDGNLLLRTNNTLIQTKHCYASILGSYVHEFESGLEYVGKGPKPRMVQSGKDLEKANNDKLVKSTFEPSAQNTDKQALIDEATKIQNK